MPNRQMELLVTFDQNYIGPFQAFLASVAVNNPNEQIRVWLLHSAIPAQMLRELESFCCLQGVTLVPQIVDRSMFVDAPISKRYPQEMYYRLLAPHFLPQELDRILYLDPDILVINPLRPLWELDLEDYTFAAAAHSHLGELVNGVNRVRLDTEHDYYNSGVMLIDLKKARSLVKPEEVFACVRQYDQELLLPDQDVFNYLYGKDTHPLDDILWNYDARFFSDYLLRSNGVAQIDWVMQNTVVLHFCGKQKPWKPNYYKRFGVLYKHYMQIAARWQKTASPICDA